MLLADLAQVHQLLDGVRAHQAIHRHVALLADAVRAVLRLQVVGRVPRRVKYHHAVGRRQVEAHAASRGGDEEDEGAGAVAVEVVNQTLPVALLGAAVQARVRPAARNQEALQDAQQPRAVRENQHLVAVGAPLVQQNLKRAQLAAVLRAGQVIQPVGGVAAACGLLVVAKQRMSNDGVAVALLFLTVIRISLHQLQVVRQLAAQRQERQHEARRARIAASAAKVVVDAHENRPVALGVAAAAAFLAAEAVAGLVVARQQLNVFEMREAVVGALLDGRQLAQHHAVVLLRQLRQLRLDDGVRLQALQHVGADGAVQLLAAPRVLGNLRLRGVDAPPDGDAARVVVHELIALAERRRHGQIQQRVQLLEVVAHDGAGEAEAEGARRHLHGRYVDECRVVLQLVRLVKDDHVQRQILELLQALSESLVGGDADLRAAVRHGIDGVLLLLGVRGDSRKSSPRVQLGLPVLDERLGHHDERRARKAARRAAAALVQLHAALAHQRRQKRNGLQRLAEPHVVAQHAAARLARSQRALAPAAVQKQHAVHLVRLQLAVDVARHLKRARVGVQPHALRSRQRQRQRRALVL